MSEPTPPPPAQPLRPGIDFKKKLTVSKIIASYADSYTDAAAELWESGLRRNSPSIPSLVLAAFAVEVYLKAFNSKPKFDPDAFGPGFVETHEYIGRRSHKLPDLYDMIPEPARADLAGRYVGAGFRTAETLRGILAEFEGVFVDVRYLHEPREKDPLPVRPDELIRLAQFFKELSQSVPEYPGTVRL